MTDATQLLRDYAEHGSEPAFRELVTRYADLVYSVALRRANGDTHLAEDIVQTVFTDLATQTRRRRGPLASGPCALGGWLTGVGMARLWTASRFTARVPECVRCGFHATP